MHTCVPTHMHAHAHKRKQAHLHTLIEELLTELHRESILQRDKYFCSELHSVLSVLQCPVLLTAMSVT